MAILLKEHERTRAARFTLNTFDSDEWVDGTKNYGLIDDLMAEIPGNDNYLADLYDDTSFPFNTTDNTMALNVGYYHRWMRVGSNCCMARMLPREAELVSE